MQRARHDAAAWTQAGLGELKISINVAKPRFLSGTLCAEIRQALVDSGLLARQLLVELTESMLMDDVENSLALMHELKALGLTLSIDDFGTGYSSLSYLKSFPLDELKIDRSFIMNLPDALSDVAIVRTVIALGHSSGMTVIAEGIETEGQLECMRQLGCDDYQGFLYSRAVPAEEFIAMVRRQR